MYSAFTSAPLVPDQFHMNEAESFPVVKEGSVLAMIQRLKGTIPESNKNGADMVQVKEPVDIESIAAEVKSFDGTAVQLDEHGNYIPQFPAIAYAQGIVGTSFHASGVEGYSDGTITSSYSISDNTRVAGYITQYVKQYQYKSGVGPCANGEC